MRSIVCCQVGRPLTGVMLSSDMVENNLDSGRLVGDWWFRSKARFFPEDEGDVVVERFREDLSDDAADAKKAPLTGTGRWSKRVDVVTSLTIPLRRGVKTIVCCFAEKLMTLAAGLPKVCTSKIRRILIIEKVEGRRRSKARKRGRRDLFSQKKGRLTLPRFDVSITTRGACWNVVDDVVRPLSG